MTTVYVESIEGYNALRMVWQHQVDRRDVQTAFQSIASRLAGAPVPTCVIVNIQDDPNFPLRETIFGALGPYRNRNLSEWLIVGENRFAHLIERTLSSITGRTNVFWFERESQALAHMDEVPAYRQAAPVSAPQG